MVSRPGCEAQALTLSSGGLTLCSLSVSLCGFQAIITALGVDRRNRVLAGLYMGRSDTQLVVRQASLHVWKIVVSNTPRTLREILPTLFGLLLGFLASTCADKRTVSLLGLPGSQP